DGKFHFVTTDAPPPGEEDLDAGARFTPEFREIETALHLFAGVVLEAQRAAWFEHHLVHGAVAGHLQADQLGRQATVGSTFGSVSRKHASSSNKELENRKHSSRQPRARHR